MKTEPARALLARGLGGTCVILATDSMAIANEIDAISDSADDIGLIDMRHMPVAGFYLFEGGGKWCSRETLDGPSSPELEWTGSVRLVLLSELPALLEMEPPWPEEST